MQPDDRVRLQHMLDAANKALEFAADLDEASLAADDRTTFAAVKCIEIIGEAAARLSDQARAEFPQIPWSVIVAMRNRLVHVYFDIDIHILWTTIQHDLPPLIDALSAFLR